MATKRILAAAVVAAVGVGGDTATGTAHADGMFNFMNPFEWFFDDDDDYWYDRRYARGPYGWGGPNYRGGPYGWGGPYGHPVHQGTQTVILLPDEAAASSEPDYPE